MTKKISKPAILVSLLYLALMGWWASLQLRGTVGTREIETFSDSIWVIAFFGGVFGLLAARKWGGFKSVFGRAISFFSLGLLTQAVGQFIYIYYAYVLDNPNPYPSPADIFFFATIPLYTVALLNLSRALAVRFSKANILGKLATLVIPLSLLAVSYKVFLAGYERCFVDETTLENICATPLQVFLDFAYPLGGAIYIAIAVLVFVLSFKLLGGIMKNKILLVLFGLLAQFTAEFHYLYLTYKGELEIGKLNDALYLSAYFLIAISIIRLGGVIDKLMGTDESSDRKSQKA